MKNPLILKYPPQQEFYFEEGCHITELSNLDNDEKVSIARARVEPGVTTRWHRLHDTVERYLILSGCGIIEVGDLPPTEVKANDVVLIPPFCPQRIKNSGEQDLIFLAICSPRFSQACYEDVENPI